MEASTNISKKSLAGQVVYVVGLKSLERVTNNMML